MKTVYILRGLPGSGKSTLASHLAMAYDTVICSADDFFVNRDGVYEFDGSKIFAAHSACVQIFRGYIALGRETIVVDNTNVRRSHMQGYIADAEKAGYTVIEVIVGKFDNASIRTYIDRNIHQVPSETILRMARDFEH